MHKAGLARSVMGGRTTAITFHSRVLGFPDPCRDFQIRKALEGREQTGCLAASVPLDAAAADWDVASVVHFCL